MKKSLSRSVKVLIALVLILGLARVVAPYAIKSYLNNMLAHLDGYQGHIEDIDLALWRGAYRVEGFNFAAVAGGQTYPFFYIDEVDLSVQWKSLLEGKVVSEVEVRQPALQLFSQLFSVMGRDSSEPVDEPETRKSLEETLSSLYPFDLNRFAIIDGTIVYTLENSEGKSEKAIVSDLNLEIQNISNSDMEGLPSPLDLNANALGSGRIKISGDTNFLKELPQWNLDGELKGLKLTDVNPILNLYTDLDFEKGVGNLYIELATEGAKLNGYIKPVIEDVDLFKWADDNDSVKEFFTEGAGALFATLFENQAKDRVASEIPIAGNLSDPKIKGLKGAWSLLRNAFIQALPNTLIEKLGFAQNTEESK